MVWRSPLSWANQFTRGTWWLLRSLHLLFQWTMASVCCFSGQWRVELGVAFGIFFVLNLCNRFVSCFINGARTSNPIWNLALSGGFFFAGTLHSLVRLCLFHFTLYRLWSAKTKKVLTQLVFFSFVGAPRCAVILCGCEIWYMGVILFTLHLLQQWSTKVSETLLAFPGQAGGWCAFSLIDYY